jgi:hypothetical protein
MMMRRKKTKLIIYNFILIIQIKSRQGVDYVLFVVVVIVVIFEGESKAMITQSLNKMNRRKK